MKKESARRAIADTSETDPITAKGLSLSIVCENKLCYAPQQQQYGMTRCNEFYEKWEKEPNWCELSPATIQVGA